MLSNIISSFSCSINSDIETFLKEKSVRFEKDYISRTYLITDEEIKNVIAYYTVAVKSVEFINHDIPKPILQKLFRRKKGIGHVVAFIIAQIGRSDKYSSKDIDGRELIDYSLSTIKEAHDKIGCNFVILDCENSEKLIKIYEDCGFKQFQKHPKLENHIQMYTILT